MIICLNELGGIGETCEQETQITITSGLFLTRPGFTFPTTANFASKDFWLAAIANNDIFPVQGVKAEESMDFEDSINESASGDKNLNFEGRRGKKFSLLLPLEMHKVLRTYNFKNLKLLYLDRSNNIRGTSPDGIMVTGFSLSYFRIPKQQSPTPENPAYSFIEIQELDINEWDKNGITINPSWLGTSLKGVLAVETTSSNITTNKFTTVVQYVDNSSLDGAGAKKTAAISGLLAANFRITDQDGAILDPAATPPADYTVTESTTDPGTYSIDATVGTITSGSIEVIPSADLLYKSAAETLTATT